MKINGIEFPFNPCNAAHLERMQTAYDVYVEENKRDRGLCSEGIPGVIAFFRADNASIAKFLDTVLGEGAADQLGADPDDHDASLAALTATCDAIKDACQNPANMNRQKRRAASNTK